MGKGEEHGSHGPCHDMLGRLGKEPFLECCAGEYFYGGKVEGCFLLMLGLYADQVKSRCDAVKAGEDARAQRWGGGGGGFKKKIGPHRKSMCA